VLTAPGWIRFAYGVFRQGRWVEVVASRENDGSRGRILWRLPPDDLPVARLLKSRACRWPRIHPCYRVSTARTKPLHHVTDLEAGVGVQPFKGSVVGFLTSSMPRSNETKGIGSVACAHVSQCHV
jgi:hypothetical protein